MLYIKGSMATVASGATGNVTITADRDMQVHKLGIECTGAALIQGVDLEGADDPIAASATNPIRVGCLANAGNPLELPEPITMRRGQSLVIQLLDLSAA